MNGLLIDIVKCVGCESCVYACLELHNQEEPEQLSSTTNAHQYTALREKNDYSIRQLCMHCENPSCVSVCPVGALQKTDLGPVIYDADKCMGCRYCMVACPFDVPKYEWNAAIPRVQKCDLCYDRQKQGLSPACAENCPEGATLFGERSELLKIAKQRIAENPDEYFCAVYGEKEAGGTSVLFLAPKSFAELGFKHMEMQQEFPELTWAALEKIPRILGFGGPMLFGIWWIINRRMKIERMTDEELEEANRKREL